MNTVELVRALHQLRLGGMAAESARRFVGRRPVSKPAAGA